MKGKKIPLAVLSVVSFIMLLSGCATDPMAQCRQMMGNMGSNPEKMQQMMEEMGNDPMMAQPMNLMRMRAYPDSPASLLAMKASLKLSGEQVSKLKAIEEQANAEAKQILSEEQAKEFTTLTGEWKPQSMMEGMQTMMPRMHKMMEDQMPCPCPMCQQMMQGK